MRNRRVLYPMHVIAYLFLMTGASAFASSGIQDTQNQFPSTGATYQFNVIDGVGGKIIDWAEQDCTATLIHPRIALSAGHCTSYNLSSLGLPAQGNYTTSEWITFNNQATTADFRCFLIETGQPGSSLLTSTDGYNCIENERSPIGKRPTFYKVVTWVTHPDFLRPELASDGTAKRVYDKALQQSQDIGVYILQNPLTGPTAPPISSIANLNYLTDLEKAGKLIGTPVLSVGYGLNWRKKSDLDPANYYTSAGILGYAASGPEVMAGYTGIRRTAFIGPVTYLKPDAILARQSITAGDDTVCYGDSGSPLFLKVTNGDDRNPVNYSRKILGVLSGETNWCQGSKDTYSRVDTTQAQSFINCVKAAINNNPNKQDANKAACECGSENYFGLCDNL